MNHYLKTLYAMCTALLTLNCANESTLEKTSPLKTGQAVPGSSVKDLSKPLTVRASVVQAGLILTEAAAPIERVPRTLRTSARVESALGGSLFVKAPSDARVIQLYVSPGSTVTKGQQLASLEVPAIAQARAALRRSRSVTEGAQRLVLQEQELERLNATSERSRIAAEQDLAVAKAEQLASQAELRAWSTTVEGGTGIVTVRAPMAGIATQIEVQTGEFIAAGTTLLRVLDPDAWEIRALVPEASALSVAVGAAQVEISSSHSCEGRVLGHQHRVEPGLGVVPFRIQPGASCAAFLLEGASLQVLMPLRSNADDANRISVPKDSITEIGEQKVLFVQGSSPEEFSAVELSSVEFWGDRAYVLGALSGGARVVSKGVLLLKGELVRADLE